jgi:hypothetical protein
MASYWHEQRVRERAHAIWEAAGRPAGKEEEHWLQAETEIATEEREAAEEQRLENDGAV